MLHKSKSHKTIALWSLGKWFTKYLTSLLVIQSVYLYIKDWETLENWNLYTFIELNISQTYLTAVIS